MYNNFKKFIDGKRHITIIQAENPDGDSLGSALALEEILGDVGYEVNMYCPVDIPKYMRYLTGWSRVTNEFYFKSDGYIIVDTAASVLLSKLLDDSAIKNILETKPVLVIDHHETEPDLPFNTEQIIEPAIATCEIIYKIAKEQKLQINAEAARCLLAGIMSDTLGLSSQAVTADTYRISAELIDLGASVWEIEESRREYMRKSPRILDYKADLIKRIEYHLDGRLATTLIPWDDIKEYSDEYNPNVLILEEMRLVEGVEVAIAIKTYPDGKLTGKLRSSLPVSEQIAGYFGGGGHAYAAGFRIYESYEQALPEIVGAVSKILAEVDNANV
jgi:phosphoesterase RecJ-like protein